MTDAPGTLRRIDWRELCPWLIILRAFRLAISVRVLLLVFLALFFNSAGWQVVANLFSKSENTTLQAWREKDDKWPLRSYYGNGGRVNVDIPELLPNSLKEAAVDRSPVVLVWTDFRDHFSRLFDPKLTIVQLAYLILGCFWSLVVWAFFGGAITRIAAVSFTREDHLSIRQALSFSRRKFGAYLAAPLFPFVGVVLVVIPLFVLGLLFKLDFFLMFSVVLWPLVLLAGAFLAIVTLGLLFGWPLMWGTISSEGTDSFDALSRSYNYIRERPLHYFFYIAFAGIIGLLGVLLVDVFAEQTINLASWGISWGSGSEQMEKIANGAEGWMFNRGRDGIGFWNGCMRMLVLAFVYGFFWCAMTAVYLLMRLKVDGAELDEVYLEDDSAFGLPSLKTDAAGVPLVGDSPAKSGEDPE